MLFRPRPMCPRTNSLGWSVPWTMHLLYGASHGRSVSKRTQWSGTNCYGTGGPLGARIRSRVPIALRRKILTGQSTKSTTVYINTRLKPPPTQHHISDEGNYRLPCWEYELAPQSNYCHWGPSELFSISRAGETYNWYGFGYYTRPSQWGGGGVPALRGTKMKWEGDSVHWHQLWVKGSVKWKKRGGVSGINR